MTCLNPKCACNYPIFIPSNTSIDLDRLKNEPGEIKIMDGQELKTGVKKDEGKPRWELLPYDAIEGVVKVLTMGAKKYEARNWERGIAYGRVFGAIQRHLTAWWNGDNLDAESGLSHLDHALTELAFLSAYEKRGVVEFDDRPKLKSITLRQG